MFSNILKDTLEHEGYYANVSGDKGGETYRGIARNYWPSWAGWKIIDEYKLRKGSLPWNYKIDSSELEALIQSFYKSNFWDKILLDKVKSESLQAIIFDGYVNSGGNAIKLMQNVLNKSFGKSLKVDGSQGQMTVNAINSVPASQLFEAYKAARVAYYKAIGTGSNAKFLDGWLKRIAAFKYTPAISVALLIGLGIGGFFLSGI